MMCKFILSYYATLQDEQGFLVSCSEDLRSGYLYRLNGNGVAVE